MPTPITITSGSEIHNDQSAKVVCYWVPSTSEHKRSSKKEGFVSAAARISNSGVVKVGANTAIPAVNGHNKDCGMWITSDYEIEDMTILKFYVCVNKGWGEVEQKANIYLRVRENAPLNKIDIGLLGTSNSNLQKLEVTGRFDIVHDIDEVKLEGVTVIPHFASLTSESRFNRVATNTELAPQIAPIPVIVRKEIVVEKADGTLEKKTVKTEAPKRRTLGF